MRRLSLKKRPPPRDGLRRSPAFRTASSSCGSTGNDATDRRRAPAKMGGSSSKYRPAALAGWRRAVDRTRAACASVRRGQSTSG
jgi:hypothetical protein